MQSPNVVDSTDLELARSVVAGSIESWHAFVFRFSGIIVSMVRRYLPDRDDDTHRDAYVRTLEHFYRTGLAHYDGKTRLSTWVMTVTRSRCLDLLRERNGRKRFPAWIKRLSEQDRHIYIAYFLHGESYAEIAAHLAAQGKTLTRDAFLHSLNRIESNLSTRAWKSIAYELEARSVRGVSRRLLQYLDQARIENEARQESLWPDFQLIEAQARAILERIAACVDTLEGDERQVVDLHFYQELPAAQIAQQLGLPGSRRAYTLIQRAVASLRTMIEAQEEDPQADPGLTGSPERRGHSD